MTQTSKRLFATKGIFHRLLLTTSLVLAMPMASALAVPVLFGGDNASVNGAPFTGGDLPAGAEIVVTGALLQLQLADGSTITVPEGSSFRVTGEGESLSIELISGSMRVDSKGLPISVTRNGTTITTSDGVFSTFASSGGGLDGRVNSGSATVAAGGESRSFSAGQGYVASNDNISGTFTPPATQTTQLTQGNGTSSYSPADERGGDGGSSDLVSFDDEEGGGPTPAGPDHVDTTPGTSSGTVDAALGGAVGESVIVYSSKEIGLDLRFNTTTVVDGDGALTEYTSSVSESLTRGTNQTADLGGNEIISVGRWNGGTTGGSYYSSPDFTYGGQQGFHYAVGVGTATPITSGTATYSLFKATSPTFGDGNGQPGTLTGSIAVAFGIFTRVGLDLEVDMPGDHIYAIKTTGGVVTPSSSSIEVNSSLWGDNAATFYANSLPVADGGIACQIAGECTADIRGFFAGDNAEGIGISYKIGGSGTPTAQKISGAAAFMGAGATGGSAPGGGASGEIDAELNDGPYIVAINGGSMATSDIVLNGDGALQSYTNSYTGVDGAGTDTAVVADLWGNEDVTIGRWTDGTVTGVLKHQTPNSTTGELFPDLQSVHYLIGTPMTNLPLYGKADYTLAAWTAPTFRDGGTEAGTFSGDLAIAFGGAAPKVGFDFSVDMPGDHIYRIVSDGGVESPHLSRFAVLTTAGAYPVGTIYRQGNGTMTIGDSISAYGRACSIANYCYVSMGGALSGEGGSSAAITYQIWQSGYLDKSLSGSAAFTTTGAAVKVESDPLTEAFADGNYAAVRIDNATNTYASKAATFGPSGELISYQAQATPINVGSSTVTDLGRNDDVMWARWTGGATGGGSTVDLSERSMHWIVGTPSATLPASGTAHYELAGYTAPTFNDRQTAPGTMSGNVAVAWDSWGSKMGVELEVNMPNDAIYNIATTGGIAVPTSSEITMIALGAFNGNGIPVTFTPQGGGTGLACSAPSCTANIDARVFGENAATIGVGYIIGSGSSISGTGVFTHPK